MLSKGEAGKVTITGPDFELLIMIVLVFGFGGFGFLLNLIESRVRNFWSISTIDFEEDNITLVKESCARLGTVSAGCWPRLPPFGLV